MVNPILPRLAAAACLAALAPWAGAASPQAAKPAPAVDLMRAAAQRVGVVRCLPALTRLSDLSLQGATSDDVVINWDREAPDKSPFFGLMGVVMPRTATHAVTFTMVPEASGTCTMLAERIAWAPQSCGEVARSELPGARISHLLPGMDVVTDDNDRDSTVSLMQAGPGCLVIRRYVRYRWRTDAGATPMRR